MTASPSTTSPSPRWWAAGDMGAFCGLALDNVTNLVILAGILTGVFGMPRDLVLGRIVPGTAVGVLVGDLAYTWLAVRLARRTGRETVTAMPLGLDTPTIFALAFGVVGPAYAATGDAVGAWRLGAAVVFCMGLLKLICARAGPLIRRLVPRAGLLGSIAGVALALIAFLPSLTIFEAPVVGLVSLGLILLALIARWRLPWNIPGAFGAVAAGCGVAAVLHATGLAPAGITPEPFSWSAHPPWPTLAWTSALPAVPLALPVALPFVIAVLVGGIDVTESAAVAGDEYGAGTVLAIDAVATMAGAFCGAVSQTTAYIGHPAYKEMGGRSGYTLATGLFIGIGGTLGVLGAVIHWLPEAAVAPILVFIGLEITAQAFDATPKAHHKAVALAFLPTLAALVVIEANHLLAGAGASPEALSGKALVTYSTLLVVGNGFILTALLWGAAAASLIDHALGRAAGFFAVCAAFSLVGAVHSPLPSGTLFLPWTLQTTLPYQLAAGYGLVALTCIAASRRRP